MNPRFDALSHSRRGPLPFVRSSILLLSLMVVAGGFRLTLAGIDPSIPSDQIRSVSPLLYASEGLVLVSALAVLMLNFRTTIEYLRRIAPITALLVLVFASVLWSVDAGITLVEGMHYASGYIVSLAVIQLYRADTVTDLLWEFCFAMIVASAVYVIAIPKLGIHQITDAEQFVHHGSWRGIFNHRTNLGYAAAGLTVTSVIRLFSGRPKVMAAVGAVTGIVFLAMAQSGGAIIVTVFTLVGLLVFGGLVRLQLRDRLVVIVVYLICATPVLFLLLLGIDAFLALFGKEPTLTGRTLIWDTIIGSGQINPLFGLGYAAGFAIVFLPILDAAGFDLVNAQGVFFDAYVAFGALGVLTLVAIHVWLLALLARVLLAKASVLQPADRFAVVGLLLFANILLIVLNVVESFFLEPNKPLVPMLMLALYPRIRGVPATMLKKRRPPERATRASGSRTVGVEPRSAYPAGAADNSAFRRS
jgi:O-antigen ligase